MKIKLLAFTAFFAVASLFSSGLQAQDGSLDLSFSGDGKLNIFIGTATDDARAIAIQPDGKILLGGYGYIGGQYCFALVRINIDGTLDLTFDTDGKVTTAIGSVDDRAYAISLQPDGKILLAGSSSNSSMYNDFALVRYNTNGSLDLTFSGDGKVVTSLGNAHDEVYAMGVQSNGKIVLAGLSSNGTNDDFAVVRYNTNGGLDATFDGDGKVITAIGTDHEAAYGMTIQSDGKILLAGYSTNAATSNDFAVVRYNSNGSLDTSFDSDGKAITPIGNGYDAANAIAIQADGKILAAGHAIFGGNLTRFVVARYNTDGSLDTSFDTDGKVLTSVGSYHAYAKSMTIQPNGKILVAGYIGYISSPASVNDFALVRYNIDGSLDNTFDTDGKVITGVSNTTDECFAMGLQSDGKILLAGAALTSTREFAIVRYNNALTTNFQTIENNNPTLLIHPNPFNTETTIQFPATTNDAELNIYNIYGQKVKTISNISDSMIRLNRGELASGFYVISLIQDKKVVATDRIIIAD